MRIGHLQEKMATVIGVAMAGEEDIEAEGLGVVGSGDGADGESPKCLKCCIVISLARRSFGSIPSGIWNLRIKSNVESLNIKPERGPINANHDACVAKMLLLQESFHAIILHRVTLLLGLHLPNFPPRSD